MKLQSESDRRIIVQGTINGKEAYVLIDTGAACGLFNKSIVKKYNLKVSRRSINLVGAGGEFKAYICDTPLMLNGKPMYQFAIADIGDVVNSIKRQTGIEIAGIIGLAQMKMMGISIDTDDNYIEIG